MVFVAFKFIKLIINSPYFCIKEIKSAEDIDITYLGGKNIFRLNLFEIYHKLANAYPQYQILKIVIWPPNSIVLKAHKRQPVARIKLLRDFFVDSEGVLFFSQEDFGDLPKIAGLETKFVQPKAGQKINLKEFDDALYLIEQFKKNPILKGYKLSKIEFKTPGDLYFFMDGVEVRIDEKKLAQGLDLLVSILSQIKEEMEKIYYIDLRFKEPVIKYVK